MATNPIGNAGSPVKKGSNVVHGLGRCPSLGRMPLEIFQSRAVDDRIHRLGHRPPEIGQVAAGIARRATGRPPGAANSGTTLDGAEESTDRDLIRRFGESVTARRAASRVKEPGALEPE